MVGYSSTNKRTPTFLGVRDYSDQNWGASFKSYCRRRSRCYTHTFWFLSAYDVYIYLYIYIYSISLGLTIHNIYCDKGIFLFHWILCLLILLGFEKDRIFLDSIDGKLQNPNASVSGSNFGSMGISPTCW